MLRCILVRCLFARRADSRGRLVAAALVIPRSVVKLARVALRLLGARGVPVLAVRLVREFWTRAALPGCIISVFRDQEACAARWLGRAHLHAVLNIRVEFVLSARCAQACFRGRVWRDVITFAASRLLDACGVPVLRATLVRVVLARSAVLLDDL